MDTDEEDQRPQEPAFPEAEFPDGRERKAKGQSHDGRGRSGSRRDRRRTNGAGRAPSGGGKRRPARREDESSSSSSDSYRPQRRRRGGSASGAGPSATALATRIVFRPLLALFEGVHLKTLVLCIVLTTLVVKFTLFPSPALPDLHDSVLSAADNLHQEARELVVTTDEPGVRGAAESGNGADEKSKGNDVEDADQKSASSEKEKKKQQEQGQEQQQTESLGIVAQQELVAQQLQQQPGEVNQAAPPQFPAPQQNFQQNQWQQPYPIQQQQGWPVNQAALPPQQFPPQQQQGVQLMQQQGAANQAPLQLLSPQQQQQSPIIPQQQN